CFSSEVIGGFLLVTSCVTANARALIFASMDVVDLREFYGGRLGAATRRMIAHRIRPRVNMPARTVLGLGFATPYLDSAQSEVRRSFVFMMARHGVYHWPDDAPASSALVDECDLPLLESTVDFAFVIHGLELADNPPEMLREVWRVLSPQ